MQHRTCWIHARPCMSYRQSRVRSRQTDLQRRRAGPKTAGGRSKLFRRKSDLRSSSSECPQPPKTLNLTTIISPPTPTITAPVWHIFWGGTYRSALRSPQHISYRGLCSGGGGGNFGSHHEPWPTAAQLPGPLGRRAASGHRAGELPHRKPVGGPREPCRKPPPQDFWAARARPHQRRSAPVLASRSLSLRRFPSKAGAKTRLPGVT